MLAQEKVTKEKGTPPSGPGCAGVPSLHHHFRGALRRAIPGPSQLSRHPCRSTPSAAIPLGLLKGDLGVVCENVRQEQKPNATDFDLPEMSQARDLVPFRRPSGGVAQGDEPHGCGEIPMAAPLKGPRMAHVSRPPERRRNEGSFAQRNPDVGVPFFGTPFLGKQERCGARKGRNPNAQHTR